MPITMKNLQVNTIFKIKGEDTEYTCIPEMGLRDSRGTYVVNSMQTIHDKDTYISPKHVAIFIHPDTEVVIVSE